MAEPIIPRVIRGRLFFVFGFMAFPTLTAAPCAASAEQEGGRP